jgi:hypothetical protein
MEPRAVLKSLREFAKRELTEKKAKSVIVYRVKMKQLMRRGRIPDFRVRSVEGARYLVCVHQADRSRIYFMSGSGIMLGVDELEGKEREKILTEISRGAKIVFRFS